MAAPLTSPEKLSRRWHKYSARYGAIHSGARFIGTRVPFVWRLLGPIVSRPYRLAWVAASGRKVLNLGGGSNSLAGCLTADVDPRSDTYVDCRKALPFNESSVDGIFCEEMIEHISKSDGLRFLRDCWRVMKPGAAIRLTTPDLGWFCTSLLRGAIQCDDFNDICYKHEHRYLYTREELEASLQACGFVEIRRSSYKEPGAQLGYLDSHPVRFNHSPDISQYLEARRPIES